jgi:DNA-binding LacI/PurR family transcriptional regulator
VDPGQTIDEALAPLLATPVHDRPTAIVVEDSAFWPAAAWLFHAGLAIPRDISVVSVGHMHSCTDWLRLMRSGESLRLDCKQAFEIDPTCRLAPPPLAGLKPATVHLPAFDMGVWAVGELARRRTAPGSAPAHRMLTPVMYEGNTIGPVRFMGG